MNVLNRKRTKIVATISDKKCDVQFLRQLYEAGMDVVRLNSAHLSPEGALKIISNVREVSEKIAILIDTKGPEIRTTVCDEPIIVENDQLIQIEGNPEKKSTPSLICVSLKNISEVVGAGTIILIDDGDVELKVLRKENDRLVCKVIDGGKIGSRKSVNIPGIKLNLPSLTDKDRSFIALASENDVDFIAHSFVRSRQDVLDVKKELVKYGSDIKVIAKIENQEGVDNLGEILDEVYGVMVARGDLAIEIPYEKIPSIQKMIISRCIYSRKPVIVATQMLHTMIENPRPTRAEVSDIANAVYWQTDALMLSGETASGKYPVEAVKTMTRIALEVESNKEKFVETPYHNAIGEISGYLAKVAVKTSVRIAARAIIADTAAGKTIKDMASFRGINPILAQSYSKRTVRELALSYGVYASYQVRKASVDEFIHIALTDLTQSQDLRGNDLVVVLAGNFSGGSGFSFIEVGTVQYLKDRIKIKDDTSQEEAT